ncbi:hypothetical protein J5X91_17760 [Pseudoalteromonas sp. K222D]|uniref:hypothetical protein n=1 Tax=Pseudoalteromonas sp. K222D TaxID=2820756 RepID=UPI001AD7C141|nr:hypothetical protein [Pseudoalteromonas sp. K222D]MBO7928083.1 hypothetical protein [Pseudoalteromonas sp. K222D]
MSINGFIPYIALAISLTALYFAARNYRRKSGIHIKGQFCIRSSTYAEDKYVSSITLENFKDRSVIIFKIFLRVGANYYIELDDFEREPKTLKSYESYTDHYEPVDFYCTNMNRIRLNKLIGSKKVKMNLVLSTSHGKYVVKEWIERWDPIFDFFNNHMTASIIPMRPKESVGYYGLDVKYLAKLHTEDGYKKTIPIYAEDYNYPRFEEFRLTEESLSSSETLKEFLMLQSINGKLQCVKVEVIDASQLRKDNYGHNFEESFEAKYYSWVYYVVIGKLLTTWSNIRLSLINLKHKKANTKQGSK